MNDIQAFANKLYEEQAAKYQDYVKQNPICQQCGRNPSVKINRWGQIFACCHECLDKELRIFNEELEADLKALEDQ